MMGMLFVLSLTSSLELPPQQQANEIEIHSTHSPGAVEGPSTVVGRVTNRGLGPEDGKICH